MPTIDDKVVAMSFEKDKFERGVKDTISILDKLKAALHFPDAGKGLDAFGRSLGRIRLDHISSGVDQISNRLSAFRLMAINVFSQFAAQAISAGTRFVKAFTLGPIISGFQEYATNLNSIQTILANTQASGATLDDVNEALRQLNEYSDKTIYNFSEMARNIGTFTAAGVGLQPAVAAIKGIANLAALSGSNSQQAATAMYQLSQAISAGRVSLMDWNSVVTAGMGGTVFQRALAQTAVAMGTLKENSLKLVGPMKNVSINGQTFRESMMTGPGKESWLTSDVLTRTLAQFTGDLTDAELAAQGFNAEQIKAIQQTAKTAQQAATQVKTFQQVLEVARETAGSGWAQTWQIIFGDFGEAKQTFTALSNAINGFINSSAKARNRVLGDWKALGGRTILIRSIKLAFEALGQILKPIRQAFRDIFPRHTAQDLVTLTARFQDLALAMRPSPKTVENLRKTFGGLFALFHIGMQVIGGIWHLFGRLFGSMGVGSGGVLEFSGNLGEFLIKLDKTLQQGHQITNFFDKLADALEGPMEALRKIGNYIANLFSGFSPGGFSGQMDQVTGSLAPFENILQSISDVWDKFVNSFNNSDKTLGPGLENISKMFEGLGPGIADAIKNMNVEAILAVIRTGLLAGMFLLFRDMFSGKKGLFSIVAKGQFSIFNIAFRNVGAGIDALTGSMQAMQTNIKARTMREIAVAVALLAASVVALSLVDPKKVNAGLTAMTIMLGELIGAMALLDKIATGAGFIKLPILTAGLIGLAVAIDLLTLAVLGLSRLEWDELTRGLVGIGAVLGGVTLAAGPLGKSSAGLIRAGFGLTAIAVGLNAMAKAVRAFGDMNLNQLAKGLGAVAAALVIVGLATNLIPFSLAFKGVGLIALAYGLKLLSDAVGTFGAMDWRTLGKGLGAVALALVLIGDAMTVMPLTLPITAAGLLLVSIALGRIVDAVAKMGGMPIGELAKGIVALGAALVVLAGGLTLMSGTFVASASLALAAADIGLLAGGLKTLSSLSWSSIIRGLVALGAAMTVMGTAGILFSAAAPSLLALGAAMLLIGGGLALAGAGIAAVGIGLSAIAVAGPTAIAILLQAMRDFTAGIGEMGKNVVLGLLEIVQAFAEVAPEFVEAVVKIVHSLIKVIIKAAPDIADAFIALGHAAIKALYALKDEFAQGGFDVILTFLAAVRDNVGEMVTIAGEVIINFLKGLATKAKDIVVAGVKFVAMFIAGLGVGALKLAIAGAKAVIKLLNGIADAIEKYEPQIIRAGFRIGTAIIKGMVKGMASISGEVKDKAIEIAKSIPGGFKKILKIFSPSLAMETLGKEVIRGVNKGMDEEKPTPEETAKKHAKKVVQAVAETFEVMERVGHEAIHDFAEGLQGAAPEINNAFRALNKQLFDSMMNARQTIKEERARLKELMKKPIVNAPSIRAAQKAIAQNEKVLALSTEAHRVLNTQLRDEKNELVALTKAYGTISGNLEKAYQVLADAKQARDDAFKDIKEQYGELPDIVSVDEDGRKVDMLAKYEESIENQTKAINTYRKTLTALRKLGLDDTTYQKLLDEGVSGQEFADQLLAGGKKAVTHLNELDKGLAKASGGLAKTASTALYQAGVDAAQGLVNGLKARKKELGDVLRDIALSIVIAVKKALKIKSPSEVFFEIGDYIVAGMEKGILDSSHKVNNAVYEVTDGAMDAMRESLSQISNMVLDEIDPNPKITPVLDLTKIQEGAKTLNSVLDSTAIKAVTSTTQASRIVARPATTVPDEAVVETGTKVVKFEQNNYSPKALDPIDVYRNTKTLFAQARRIVMPEES